MKIHMTTEEIRRPLGSGLPPEARCLAGHINAGDYNDEGFGIPEGGPIDWDGLNRDGAEADQRSIESGPKPKR